MGGNRRFRGMKRPASKGYSRLSMMEDNSKYHDGTETNSIFWSVVFSLLCVAALVVGTFVVVKFSLQFSSPSGKDSGESYTSSDFQTTDGMPSTETDTEKQGYSSTDFPSTDGLSSSETITDKQAYSSKDFLSTDGLSSSETITNKQAYSSKDFKSHQPQILSSEEVDQVTRSIDIDHLLSTELSPLMKTRVPDTLGNEEARQHITSRLQSHDMWTIELDEFQDHTPFGKKKFVNIVATLRPDIKRRLVLACHYDSKYFPPQDDGKVFIGATDSAVPCAMILDLAHNLANLLESTTQVSTSLQLIFFDGEEAFREWTNTDSLYGARHLSAKMQDTPHPPRSRKTNQLDAMDMFVLLDLIGTPDPIFRNYFSATSSWFNHLHDIETRLKEQGQIQQRGSSYFYTPRSYGSIQDDHIPFVRKGMDRVIHLIASPFPPVWHTMNDNEDALDPPTIDDLNKILHVFVVEYLHLLDSQPAPSAA